MPYTGSARLDDETRAPAMPWRAAPNDAVVPAIPATDGPFDLPRTTGVVELKSDPDSIASLNSDNDTPRTDKPSQPLRSSDPAPEKDRDADATDIPNGGLRAWLVVLGGFIDFMIALGA